MSPRIVSKNNISYAKNTNLAQKIHSLLAIDNGESGIIIAVAVFTGLRAEEIVYIYNEQVCQNDIGVCGCRRLHVFQNKSKGIVAVEINWITSRSRCYITMMPAKIWENFRSLPCCNESDVAAAGKLIQTIAKVKLSDLREIFYHVMTQTMTDNDLNILSGRAAPAAAKYALLSKLDNMVTRYVKAWKGVVRLVFGHTPSP